MTKQIGQLITLIIIICWFPSCLYIFYGDRIIITLFCKIDVSLKVNIQYVVPTFSISIISTNVSTYSLVQDLNYPFFPLPNNVGNYLTIGIEWEKVLCVEIIFCLHSHIRFLISLHTFIVLLLFKFFLVNYPVLCLGKSITELPIIPNFLPKLW